MNFPLSQINIKQDQRDRDGLRADPVPHDPVGVLAVKVTAFAKCADAKQQYTQHNQHGNYDENEKRIACHDYVPYYLAVGCSRHAPEGKGSGPRDHSVKQPR